MQKTVKSLLTTSTFNISLVYPFLYLPSDIACVDHSYNYIYTSTGVSLHEFAISLLKDRNCSAKDNDDLCTICADGGNLLLCDGCPRAFHKGEIELFN